MNFLKTFWTRFAGSRPAAWCLVEAHCRRRSNGDRLGHARADCRGGAASCELSGLRKGDRCALVAPNSIRWTALDLAIIAEGLIAVPDVRSPSRGRIGRDAARRRAGLDLLRRCGASRCDLGVTWPDAPRFVLFDEIFSANSTCPQRRAISRLPPRFHAAGLRSRFCTPPALPAKPRG